MHELRASLSGPFCHQCGQHQDDLHRSLWRLGRETAMSFVDVDGRILRTLPRLFFRPASLTRDYLAGERMSQTPPLRLFLAVVVLVFLAGAIGNADNNVNFRVVGSPQEAVRLTMDPASRNDIRVLDHFDTPKNDFERWLIPRLERSLHSPQAFAQTLLDWTQRLAILLLPIGALTLGALFAFSRRLVMFDHLIFTMHSLAAQGVLLSLVMVAGRAVPVLGWLVWLAPVHVFVHLRGVYGTGVFGTLTRMLGLVVGAFIGVGLLAFVLLMIAVSEVGGRWSAMTTNPIADPLVENVDSDTATPLVHLDATPEGWPTSP